VRLRHDRKRRRGGVRLTGVFDGQRRMDVSGFGPDRRGHLALARVEQSPEAVCILVIKVLCTKCFIVGPNKYHILLGLRKPESEILSVRKGCECNMPYSLQWQVLRGNSSG
jgi:hypothetical protein